MFIAVQTFIQNFFVPQQEHWGHHIDEIFVNVTLKSQYR